MPQQYLPEQSTPFIGRGHDIQQILQMLNQRCPCLVTLVGMGGIGKTRLAIEVGNQFANQNREHEDVLFVPLAPLTNPEHIENAISEIINLKQSTTDTSDAHLINYFKHRSLLLILDNFEHILDGKSLVKKLLAQCPRLRILVTSRERLNLDREQVYPVNGFSTPTALTLDEADKADAIRLFSQIAQKVDWNFKLSDDNLSQMLTICQIVEGVPLAIELSAAWLRMMSLDKILSRLRSDFDTLADSLSHLPERHRSLRTVFESSWQLLTVAEQQIYAQLSIFKGGFTHEAVHAMFDASPQQVLSFIDKSLVHRVDDNRYSLHELLRQYAEEKLKDYPDLRDRVHERHAQYFADYLAQRDSFFSINGKNRSTLLHEISQELDNIRQLWHYAIDTFNIDIIEQTVETIYHLHRIRGNYSTGYQMLREALTSLDDATVRKENLSLYVKLNAMIAIYAELINVHHLSLKHATEALKLAQQLDLDVEIARSELALCIYWASIGDLQQAKYYGEHAIKRYQYIDDIEEQTSVHIHLGWTYQLLGDYDNAERLFLALIYHNEDKDNLHQLAQGNIWLALLYNLQKDYLLAKSYGLKSLSLFEAVGIRAYAMAVRKNLAISYWGLGNFTESRKYFREALHVFIFESQRTFINAVISTIAWIVYLLHSEGSTPLAVEVAAFILDEPRANYEARDTIRQIYPILRAELQWVVFETAQDRGRTSYLDEIVDRLYSYLQPISDLHIPPQKRSGDSINHVIKETLATGKIPENLANDPSRDVIETIARGVEEILEIEKSKMMVSFMESASHDLRTPITIINSSLYLLEHIQDPERQKDKLELVRKQVSHLNNIIDKLLMMAQLDSGVHFDFRQFNLVSLVRGIHAQIKSRADMHQVELQLGVLDKALPVKADSSYLQDAIVQLLDNAFGNTSPGGTVTLQCYKDNDRAVISVVDNGIGIQSDQIRYVFNRFYRIEPARTPSGRSGLGLAIVKSIVTAHDGKCTVVSTPDEGTTFSIRLPLL